jgi:hypothetical protein
VSGYWRTIVQAFEPDFPPFTFTAIGPPDADYKVVPYPPRTDAGGPCKARFAGTLNGVVVWTTNNCESRIEIILEKDYVFAG